jgi:hypothetical protein
MTEKTCPICAAPVSAISRETYFEVDCTNDPSHYSGHERKPGAIYLWGPEYHTGGQLEQL